MYGEQDLDGQLKVDSDRSFFYWLNDKNPLSV